jgi:hypothetical protein
MPYFRFVFESMPLIFSTTLAKKPGFLRVGRGCGGGAEISGTGARGMAFVERDRGILVNGGRLSITLGMTGRVVLREMVGIPSMALGGRSKRIVINTRSGKCRCGTCT